MSNVSTGRQPIHLEQRGGKSNRQRIWEAIRQHRSEFSLGQIASKVRVNYATAQTYFSALQKAGVITQLKADENQAFKEVMWCLEHDRGVEAPRLKRDGSESSAGLGTEAMWRTLRILGCVTAVELASHASVSVPTTKTTAQSYLRWLKKAGYVHSDGGRPQRYQLIKSKVTGPRAPQIQRVGQVYDPNTAAVAYVQSPEEFL